MNMENFFIIGEIIKPQGIKGEVKIKPYTDDVRRFLYLKEAYIDGVTHVILSARADEQYAYILFKGFDDRDKAEALRNKLISIERKDFPALKKNNYFIADLTGCGVFTESGGFLGNIAGVTKGNRDIITVNLTGGGTLLFPFLKDLLIDVDIQNKKMVIKEERLKEVGVYN